MSRSIFWVSVFLGLGGPLHAAMVVGLVLDSANSKGLEDAEVTFAENILKQPCRADSDGRFDCPLNEGLKVGSPIFFTVRKRGYMTVTRHAVYIDGYAQVFKLKKMDAGAQPKELPTKEPRRPQIVTVPPSVKVRAIRLGNDIISTAKDEAKSCEERLAGVTPTVDNVMGRVHCQESGYADLQRRRPFSDLGKMMTDLETCEGSTVELQKTLAEMPAAQWKLDSLQTVGRALVQAAYSIAEGMGTSCGTSNEVKPGFRAMDAGLCNFEEGDLVTGFNRNELPKYLSKGDPVQIRLYAVKEHCYVDVDLTYQSFYHPRVRVTGTQVDMSHALRWSVRTSASGDKIEITNQYHRPMLQIQYEDSFTIRLSGIFPLPDQGKVSVISKDRHWVQEAEGNDEIRNIMLPSLFTY